MSDVAPRSTIAVEHAQATGPVDAEQLARTARSLRASFDLGPLHFERDAECVRISAPDGCAMQIALDDWLNAWPRLVSLREFEGHFGPVAGRAFTVTPLPAETQTTTQVWTYLRRPRGTRFARVFQMVSLDHAQRYIGDCPPSMGEWAIVVWGQAGDPPRKLTRDEAVALAPAGVAAPSPARSTDPTETESPA
jgi:hypothetical protein